VRIVCPLCKKVLESVPPDFPSRPFCSARCKLVDLHNWLGGSYRIETDMGVEQPDDEGLGET
jgi:endogenous inhibitor of DNA gyrase (YacG/DUF329 family)